MIGVGNLSFASPCRVPLVHPLGWVGRHHRIVDTITGAALVAIGVLMLTDTLNRPAALTSPLGT